MEQEYELTFKDKVTAWFIIVTWMVGLYTTIYWTLTGMFRGIEWLIGKFRSKKADRNEDDDLF